MDPTPPKHPKTPTSATTPFIPTTTAAASMTRQRRHPDPTALQNFPTHQPSSRLKPTHRARTSLKPSNPQPPPPAPSHRVDTHSQAKRMSVSAIADSSKAFLVKPHRLHATFVAEKHRETSKSDLKEKLKKSSARVPKGKEEKELNVAMDIVKPFASLGVAGGRRRSFGGSKVELGDFLTCNGVKVVSVDMPAFMQIHAVDCARKTRDSLEKFTSKTLAQTLKKEFDEVYGPAWHCIVGTSFGSFVTHSVGFFLYFSMDQKLYVLLFKTTVQRAD